MMLSLPLAGCGNKEVDDISTNVTSEDTKDVKETEKDDKKEENKDGSAVGFAASQYIDQVNQIGGAADAE